jgi:hypothetical protein
LKRKFSHFCLVLLIAIAPAVARAVPPASELLEQVLFTTPAGREIASRLIGCWADNLNVGDLAAVRAALERPDNSALKTELDSRAQQLHSRFSEAERWGGLDLESARGREVFRGYANGQFSLNAGEIDRSVISFVSDWTKGFRIFRNFATTREAFLGGYPAEFDRGIYDEARSIAQLIQNDCHDCLIFGIGRSPTAITTYLELVAPETSGVLPLSGISEDSLGKHADSAFLRYLDNYLPPPAIIKSHKTLVLVDYASTGTSLETVRDGIRRYFIARAIPCEVKTAAISFGAKPGFDWVFTRDQFPRIIDPLSGHGFDRYAKFSQFRLHLDQVPALNPEHARFRDWMAQLIAMGI